MNGANAARQTEASQRIAAAIAQLRATGAAVTTAAVVRLAGCSRSTAARALAAMPGSPPKEATTEPVQATHAQGVRADVAEPVQASVPVQADADDEAVRPPARPAPRPIYCAKCRAFVGVLAPGDVSRCPGCGRSVVVGPAQTPTRTMDEPTTTPRCPECGKVLTIHQGTRWLCREHGWTNATTTPQPFSDVKDKAIAVRP